MCRKISSAPMLAVVAAFFILSLGLSADSLHAQEATPTPTPESEELRRLKEQNAILEQEKKAAEFERDKAKANKEELDAKFPKPSTTPLEGKTEVDAGVKIESEMLAYSSMAEAADKIRIDIGKTVTISNIKGIAIHNDRDIKTLLGYMVITSQLKLMQDEYNRLISSPIFPLKDPSAADLAAADFAAIPAGINIATSVLGSFIDLIGLFRTDTNVKGMSFNIEETALVSEVFRAIRSKNGTANLFYPATVPPNINANTEFVILAKIQALYMLKARAEDLITKIDENEKALKETKGKIKALGERPKEIKEELAALRAELKNWQACGFPGCAERAAQVKIRINALVTEDGNIPGKIAEAEALKAKLETALDEQYRDILPQVETFIQIKLADAQQRKLAKAEAAKGSPLNAAEITANALTPGDVNNVLSSAERALLAAIKAKEMALGQPPTEAEKESLLNAVDKATLRKLKQEALLRLKALNVQFNKLTEELIKVDGGTGINSLTAYLQAENLTRALGCTEVKKSGTLKCPDAYLLQLKVVSAGGNNRIRRNLIRDVFKGADISHSGGSIVEYILYDVTTGASKASNTITVYKDYINAKKIPGTVASNP